MYVGTPGAVEHAADKEFVVPEAGSADGAYPGPIFLQAIGAAPDVHEPVFAGKGGEGHGFNQFALFEPGGTDRAGLGGAGDALPARGPLPFMPFGMAGTYAAGKAEKEGVAKPEQHYPYGDKGQNLNK
jgi:hypothetical protein